MNKFIQTAIDCAGGQTALAVQLGLAPSNVVVWLKNDRPIPVQHVKKIIEITGGKVSVKDLRPNDWEKIWPELVPPKTTVSNVA